MIIVMGGPMSVNDKLSWITREIAYLQQAIAANKMVIGICLGAQLIASALGSSVRRNAEREIGWFPITATENTHHWASTALPPKFTPLHWHGDTFDLPERANLLFRSQACENQAFHVGENVVGLQFHLEFDLTTAIRVAEACESELLAGGKFVQTKHDLLNNHRGFATANQLMFRLLDAATTQLSNRTAHQTN